MGQMTGFCVQKCAHAKTGANLGGEAVAPAAEGLRLPVERVDRLEAHHVGALPVQH